jgi:hypothetical protein
MNATFARIDPVLDAWAQKLGLHVYRKHQDEEVRAIQVVDDAGATYGVSIECAGDSYMIRCGWTAGKKGNRQLIEKRWERLSSTKEFSENLEDAYSTIERWIAENGHTRTWVR